MPRRRQCDIILCTMKMRIPRYLPAVLMLGAVSQIGQVLFLRELLMVFHGNEISIGLILAAWLAWVGVGSSMGAAILERIHRPLLLLMLNAAGVLLALPASILLMRSLRGFFDVLPGAGLSLLDMAVSCFLVMALPCLLLGGQFVLLSRIWRESDGANDTSGAGKAYVGEAAGNIIGGILFTFVMVKYLGALHSAVLAGTLMLVFVLLIGHRRATGPESLFMKLRRTLWAMVLICALAFPFLGRLDDRAYDIQWRHFAPQHQLLETSQSKHGVISVARRDDQYSFFQSGHLLFTIAGADTAKPGFEEQEAAEFVHLSMVQHDEPERVLLIGGGLRGTLGEMLKHPVKIIDYVELDEALTATALRYARPATLEALGDPRVNLIHADGRLFVKAADEQYDMIIVDVPDPVTAVLNRFYTKEFFREAKALLKGGGVLVIGAASTPGLRGTAIANRNSTIYHTLSSVFTHVLPAGERFMFYFASDSAGQITADASLLQERYRARGIESEGFSSHHYHSLLQKSQLERVNWTARNHGRDHRAHIEGAGAAPLFPGSISVQKQAERRLPPVYERYFINSDFKPLGYFYTLMFRDDQLRSGQPEVFNRLLRIRPVWIVPFILVPISVALALRAVSRRAGKRNDARFAVLFTVFTTGLSTMALQVALLFVFQSVYGFVYETAGLIVAMFMGGLACGALFAHRRVADKANLNILAAVQLGIAAFSCLLAVTLPATAAIRSSAVIFASFSALTFASGFINGVDFPLATACCMSFNGRAERSAGLVYGVELFGACTGAALASAFIAPILGIAACCLFAGIANGTAFVILRIGDSKLRSIQDSLTG